MAHQKAARSPSTLCLAATLLLVLCFASAPAGAQAVGPSYTTPPSITYGEFYRDVELAAISRTARHFRT
jgi:hypothetical protein